MIPLKTYEDSGVAFSGQSTRDKSGWFRERTAVQEGIVVGNTWYGINDITRCFCFVREYLAKKQVWREEVGLLSLL